MLNKWNDYRYRCASVRRPNVAGVSPPFIIGLFNKMMVHLLYYRIIPPALFVVEQAAAVLWLAQHLAWLGAGSDFLSVLLCLFPRRLTTVKPHHNHHHHHHCWQAALQVRECQRTSFHIYKYRSSRSMPESSSSLLLL
jgi:hypothetical protein